MATIFCFSSTGNSLHTARVIAEKISATVKPMTKTAEICNDDVVGFVFPVYFWGLPKAVERFISAIEITNKNAYVFSLATCGGKASGVNGAVKKLLKKKGIKLAFGKNVKSVENYIPMFKVNNSEEFQKKVDANIELIAKEIEEKKHRKVAPYTFINKIVYSLFPANKADSDSLFTVSKDCNSCGICKMVCPASNIEYQNGKPVFLHKCEHCIACVHACPKSAINWKQSTENKQRYLNPNISIKELSEFNS